MLKTPQKTESTNSEKNKVFALKCKNFINLAVQLIKLTWNDTHYNPYFVLMLADA